MTARPGTSGADSPDAIEFRPGDPCAGISSAAEENAVSAGITVVSGTPTPAELAAVAAVITTMAQELSDAVEEPPPVRSAWQNSQRCVRQPLSPGPNAWRAFVG